MNTDWGAVAAATWFRRLAEMNFSDLKFIERWTLGARHGVARPGRRRVERFLQISLELFL